MAQEQGGSQAQVFRQPVVGRFLRRRRARRCAHGYSDLLHSPCFPAGRDLSVVAKGIKEENMGSRIPVLSCTLYKQTQMLKSTLLVSYAGAGSGFEDWEFNIFKGQNKSCRHCALRSH